MLAIADHPRALAARLPSRSETHGFESLAFLLAAATEREKHEDVAELRRALLKVLQRLEQP